MAHFSLFKFQIELSDVARARYETIEFRAAQHPSESMPYFLTRVLAFALNFEDDLTFAPTGLHDPDAAAIHIPDHSGGFKTLIEIGSPSARKLHKATKTAKIVKVYTYKNPQTLIDEIIKEKVHRASEIEVFSLELNFLSEIEGHLKLNNRWGILFNDGTISVQVGDHSMSGELRVHRCPVLKA
jgi:uncharacterized protein YaeQ